MEEVLKAASDAHNTLITAVKEETKRLKRKREELDIEQKEIAEFKMKMIQVSENNKKMVKLNVGGEIFSTTISTFNKEPSMLSAMFSGNFNMEPGQDGAYFIDRDPKYFPMILNYLRMNVIDTEDMGDKEKNELLREVEYYQIPSLLSLLKNFEEKERKNVQNKKRSKKAVKDIDLPKRPKTAFIFFSTKHRAIVQKENRDWGFSDVAREISTRWKNLSNDGKEPYQQQADEDKKRYDVQKAKYDAKNNDDDDTEDLLSNRFQKSQKKRIPEKKAQNCRKKRV